MIQLFYILFCIGLAYINYRVIIADRKVFHGLNALLHVVFWVVVWFKTKDALLVAMLPFIGRLFFDCALNLMRGREIEYVPLNPKSWVDKAEKKIFDGDGLLPKAIWLLIIILLNILYYA